ncbi:MAG: putative CopG family antitoxin [Patescibacteria group bacterium]|jgi:predicted CopG family antitoxin
MASINISITQEAYSFLKALKNQNQSFSQIILELKNNKNVYQRGSSQQILKFWGALKDKDWNITEQEIQNYRKSKESRIKKTVKYKEKTQ